MFKKTTFVMMAMLFSVAATAQEWIGFGSRAEGAPPEVSISRSDNQQVSFAVSLSGMYAESKDEALVTYKRLSMPQCEIMGEVGAPEIPVVTKMIAIPECSEIMYNVTMSGVQTFTDYMVYPVPEQQPRDNDAGAFYIEEVFTKDVAAYAQNIAMPVEDFSVLDEGALRSQRYVRLELHPVQYNPVTQTLTVATEMEVSLTFTGATTPVNVPLGIFSNVAKNTMVNFEDQGIKASINDKAFEKPGFQKGNVQWKRFWAYWDVENITADYLIICADVFFPEDEPNAEIQRLANHRAEYNGFDVMILNAEDIINAAFYFEEQDQHSGPDYEFKKEQRLRTCIRTIYETGTAHHTMDGKLGYVLLIGDVDGGQGSTGNNDMPSSYDNPQTQWMEPEYVKWRVYASDYYYSCITKDPTTGIYDECGDLYIGRLFSSLQHPKIFFVQCCTVPVAADPY